MDGEEGEGGTAENHTAQPKEKMGDQGLRREGGKRRGKAKTSQVEGLQSIKRAVWGLGGEQVRSIQKRLGEVCCHPFRCRGDLKRREEGRGKKKKLR